MAFLFWLGSGVFVAFLLLGVVGFFGAKGKEMKLEKLGIAVPGISGLLLALSTLVENKIFSLLLIIAALPTLLVGRACYELLVFREKKD